MKKYFVVMIYAISITINAQNEISHRQPFTLDLIAETGKPYHENIPDTKYFIEDRVLQIYPGEKIFVEVEIKQDSIISMRVVDKKTRPNKTFTLELFQHKGKMETWLKVSNPLRKKKLLYDAEIFLLKRDEWIETDVLPVSPKKTASEVWANTISAVRLKKMRLE